MPRGHRIFFENAHYHVTSRGNDKRPVFTNLQDRSHYLTLLARVKEDFGLLLPAFALMTNHIHLYVITPKGNLSEAMFALNNEYSHQFNKRHGSTGHLFEGRYKYKLIQSDRYALALTRYIHMNPVKAGLAPKAEEYPWSSAAEYLGNGSFDFVDKDLVLRTISDNPEKARELYRDFMAEAIPGKFWRPFDKNRNMVLGDRDFKAAHSPHEAPDTPQKEPGSF